VWLTLRVYDLKQPTAKAKTCLKVLREESLVHEPLGSVSGHQHPQAKHKEEKEANNSGVP
jgi:hypothetical protein